MLDLLLFSLQVMPTYSRPYELQHTRLPCPLSCLICIFNRCLVSKYIFFVYFLTSQKTIRITCWSTKVRFISCCSKEKCHSDRDNSSVIYEAMKYPASYIDDFTSLVVSVYYVYVHACVKEVSINSSCNDRLHYVMTAYFTFCDIRRQCAHGYILWWYILMI